MASESGASLSKGDDALAMTAGATKIEADSRRGAGAGERTGDFTGIGVDDGEETGDEEAEDEETEDEEAEDCAESSKSRPEETMGLFSTTLAGLEAVVLTWTEFGDFGKAGEGAECKGTSGLLMVVVSLVSLT